MKAVVIALLLITSSCNLFGPTIECDDAVDLGRETTCEEVIAAAGEQLGEVGGITRLTIARGRPCDVDSLTCGPDVPVGTVWAVYADLADGRRIAVPVYAEDDGSLRAGPLQEMSPAP